MLFESHEIKGCLYQASLSMRVRYGGATVITESKKFSLFLLSNFMYCENAVPIRVKGTVRPDWI
jgi:hypothetical protein